MAQKFFNIQFIKIRNFKSYQETLYIGPIGTLTGITGRNGSGKTNLIDAIVFLLGGVFSDLNCISIKNVFPAFDYGHLESKVGAVFSEKEKIFDLTRIVDQNNISEFFVSGTKVSFDFFVKFIKDFRCGYFKELMILKNPIDNKLFTNPIHLANFIDKASGSKNLSLVHLKISILKKKLQENCAFYFRKLKYLNREKVLLKTQQKNLIVLKKEQFWFRFWNFIRIKKKTIFFLNKMWKITKKINKEFRTMDEIQNTKASIFKTLFWFRNISKKKICIQNKTERIMNFFLLLQNVGKKIVRKFSRFFTEYVENIGEKFCCVIEQKLCVLRKEEPLGKKLDYFESTRIVQSNNGPKHDKIPKKFPKNFFTKYIYIKSVFFRTSEKKKNSVGLNPLILRKLSIFSIIFKNTSRHLKIKNLLFFSQSKKFLSRVFFLSFCLIFILLEKQYKASSKKSFKFCEKRDKLFINLTKKFTGIRGKMSEVAKPLDSKYRTPFERVFRKKNIILLDTQKTLKGALKFLENSKDCAFSFLAVNNLNKAFFSSRNKLYEKKEEFSRFLDVDLYDFPGVKFTMGSKFFLGNQYVSALFFRPHGTKTNSYIKKEAPGLFLFSFSHSNPTVEISRDEEMVTLKRKVIMDFFKEKLPLEENREASFLKRKEKYPIYIPDFKYFNKKTIHDLIFNLRYFKQTLVFWKEILKDFYKKKVQHDLQSILSIKNMELTLENFEKKILGISRENLIYLIFGRKQIFFLKFVLNFYINKFINYKNKQTEPLVLNNIFVKIVKQIFFKKVIFFIQWRIRSCSGFLKILWTLMSFKPFLEKDGIRPVKNLLKIKKLKNKIITLMDIYCKKKEKTLNSGKILKNFKNKVNEKLSKYGSFFSHTNNSQLKKKPKIKNTRKDISFLFESLIINKKSRHIGDKKPKEHIIFPGGAVTGSFVFSFIDRRTLIVEKRFREIKKELKKNRFRFYIATSKFNKISTERKKRYLFFTEDLSKKINNIYKNLTSSISNHLGGTAFLTLTNTISPFFGEVLFSAVPPLKKINDVKELSGGEKTIASTTLIIALGINTATPFIFLDEIDAHLDDWNSEKLFRLLNILTIKKLRKICIVTQKIRFYLFFTIIIYIFKNQLGSNVLTFDLRTRYK